MGRRVRQQLHPSQEDAGHQRFADPTEGQRTEGHAELYSGQKIVQFMLEAAHGAGAGNAVGQQLLDACVADGNQREFRGHEEAVGQDQHGDGDAFTSRRPCISPVSIAFGPRKIFADASPGTEPPGHAYGVISSRR